ncbi:hypothetical protein SAMN05216251_108200 [Actinacidiphila alni]|uniref:Uncharacterized protein n=1 Tax=Actinacidiphila alni TaxID=380248 RepID=A0A1I2G0S2_9ACTN|nr:hypothetical protein [Actinacidiphila alni]SFF11122.1 hypothetical protein SAMN05216251_108200 [Actinacidiphila alni]
MTAAAVALCACCQQPVQPGQGRRIPVDQGTSASADVLLHRWLCTPVNAYGGRKRNQLVQR